MLVFRYLLKEIGSNFLAVTIILLLIFLSSRFVKYLGDAAAGSFSSEILLWIMLYRLPGFLEFILPLAFYIGIMLAYGRLYVDSEMTVLQACGISKQRLLLYTQGAAVAVMLLVLLLTTWITPLGWKKFHEIWNDPENFSGLATLVEGSFRRMGGGTTVIYTARLNADKTELGDVFVVRQHGDNNDNQISIIRAEQARVLNFSPHQRYIELLGGAEYTGTPGQLDFSVSSFKRYGQLLQTSEKSTVRVDSVDARATVQLWQSMEVRDRAAWHWRIGMPFMIPVVAVIALALSETSHRRGRYVKLLPGIIIYIFYAATLIYAKNAMDEGNPGAVDIFWSLHGLFLLFGLLLLYRDVIAHRIVRLIPIRSRT